VVQLFQDLWERTDHEQRLCLLALLRREEQQYTIQDVADQTQLTLNVVRRTLERLRQRDLILFEEGKYRVVSLLIERWIERNS